MKKETKLFDVALCTGDCKECKKMESKPIEKNFVLLKKRVSTHYIPPDMTAIKLMNDILENENKKDSLLLKTNAELKKIKDKVVGECDKCLKKTGLNCKVESNKTKNSAIEDSVKKNNKIAKDKQCHNKQN